MPGKDGTPVHTTEALQQLIRLLHREHGRLGGTIAVCRNCSCPRSGPPNADIMFAGCLSPSECPKCGLRNSEVNYFPACRTSYLTIASCFWSWWKTQPSPSADKTHILSHIVVPGNIYVLMLNGLMFRMKLPLTW